MPRAIAAQDLTDTAFSILRTYDKDVPLDSRSHQTQINHPSAVVRLPEEETLPILQDQDIIGGHRISWSSNYTFLIRIDAGPGKHIEAIYKPRDGERPLYDFPDGSLYKREYAAFLVSRVLGWPNVPLTVIRDGPYGIGSVQILVKADPQITYFDMVNDRPDSLIQLAVFDVLANNADRKGGHCLKDADGKIWSIDHGLTFHSHFKLRTVMLEYWGQSIPKLLISDIESMAHDLETTSAITSRLSDLLTTDELNALKNRLHILLKNPVIPTLDPQRNVPWPVV